MTAGGSQIIPASFVPPGAKPPPVAVKIPVATVMIGLALVISIFLAWFLVSARAVYIEVSPASSDVDIDGGMRLQLADRYLLRTGEYGLRIEAEGYQLLVRSLVIGKEQNQHYSFDLQPLPGRLRVDTGPVTGAQVFIDDTPRATTPAVIGEIPAGEHRLRVSAERYFSFEDTVMIEGLDHEQVVSLLLKPAWADVTFVAEPAGADVFVDDELLGQTPLKTGILEGAHRVRIQLAGFKPWQNEIDVTANSALNFTDIRLQPADAVVFLVSEPPRANVTVDGEYKGVTPLELALTPEQTSTVRLFKQGYQPGSRQLTVGSGSKQHLQVTLVPELVTIEFHVTPPDAELYIDDKSYGAAGQTLQLPASSHRIEIRREGYVDYKTTITPHSGMAQQLDIKLKTLQQAKLEQVKPIITTSAGQSLKLFYPSAFAMGASRREPGRRANETIRTIELTRPFYLGLHEVTNEQYRLFAKDHSSGTVQGRSLDDGRQPVVQVTWEQAVRYCNWLSQRESLAPFYIEKEGKIAGVNPLANGYRLPTEAEWEWAARVAANQPPLKFPWGQDMPPPNGSGNYADEPAASLVARIIQKYQDGYSVAAPIGSFPAGNHGLFDIGGNVAEWVHDFYDIAVGNTGTAELDPIGPEQGEFHVIKGSSWAHGTITELRLSYRDYYEKARQDVGFRLARYLE
jgi:formylglycine-generating enzyme required for sulfatase activity